jgi:hypothetical protein
MDVVILKFIYLHRIGSSDPRNKSRVETLTGCISHRLELTHLCKYYSAVLHDLKEEEDTGNWKHKHSVENSLWKRLRCRETDCGMNESTNQSTIRKFVPLKTAIVENMKVLGLKVSSVKFLTVFYTQDYSVPARCHFLLFQRQRFGKWICCRLRVKVWGGVY